MLMTSKVMIFTAVVGMLISGCGDNGKSREAQGDGRLNVVCTTGMITDLVKNIAGDKAEALGLMGPGVDPHLYKASQGDMEKLAAADIIFYNGLHLEGKLTEILEKMAQKKRVIPVSRSIPKGMLIKIGEAENAYDPHIWFDLSLWMQTVEVVVEEMSEVDGKNAEEYRINGDKYLKELGGNHNWALVKIADIPPNQRVLITAHDAFSYFGRAYNIEVVALQGISTVAEYGVNDVTRLVDLIVERGIKAVFVESSVSPRSINAVREGVRARGIEVEIGGVLYSDAMGAPGSGADTYIGMVKTNVNTIMGVLK